MQRPVASKLGFLQRTRPKRDVLAAAFAIRGVAVVVTNAVRRYGNQARAKVLAGPVAVLDRKFLRLCRKIGLPPLFLNLFGIGLLFLMNFIL